MPDLSLISIILLNDNGEHWVIRCLESILNQTRE